LGIEHFDTAKSLNLHPAPETLYTDELTSGKLGWLTKLGSEAYALTGKDALQFSPTDRLPA
jgi:hypothetical protein